MDGPTEPDAPDAPRPAFAGSLHRPVKAVPPENTPEDRAAYIAFARGYFGGTAEQWGKKWDDSWKAGEGK